MNDIKKEIDNKIKNEINGVNKAAGAPGAGAAGSVSDFEKNRYFVDVYSESLFKNGEELCGDMVEVIRKPDETVVVLADGMGSGVKANILSTLTSKIICTMISGDADIDDCVETISKTLPVCSVRGVAYSTFTIIRVRHDGEVYTAEFDGPEIVVVRDGVLDEPDKTMRVIEGKEVWESSFRAGPGDMIVGFSDGVIHAGIGRLINLGWKRVNVMEFIQRSYRPDMTAREMARELIGVCDQLYEGEPGDDTTVAAVRVIPRTETRVMVGPAASKEMDEREVMRLLGATGKKIVCGGTTSKVVARVLGQEVDVETVYYDDDVPPVGYIKGIDLVTEGVLTLSAAERLLDEYIEECSRNKRPERGVDLSKKDGATRLVRCLTEGTSDIVFMIGAGVNPAHKPGGAIPSHDVKVRIVQELARSLTELGKNVSIEEY